DPQILGQAANSGYLAIQQEHRDQARSHRYQGGGRRNLFDVKRTEHTETEVKIARLFEPGPDVARVLRKAYATGRYRERRAEGELPDEQKGHHPAETPGAINLF